MIRPSIEGGEQTPADSGKSCLFHLSRVWSQMAPGLERLLVRNRKCDRRWHRQLVAVLNRNLGPPIRSMRTLMQAYGALSC